MPTKNTFNYEERRRLAKVVGGEILFMVSEAMGQWLDSHNARIIGKSDGAIHLALDDKDFKGLENELFKEEQVETTQEN